MTVTRSIPVTECPAVPLAATVPAGWLRAAARVAAVAAFALVLQWLADPMVDHVTTRIPAQPAGLFDPVVVTAALVYVVAMALPFVPGIEIGLAIMLVLGPDSFLAVYACTQVALLLSYVAGRLLPPGLLAAMVRRLRHGGRGTDRAGGRVPDPMPGFGQLLSGIRWQWLRRLAGQRYLALAILINLPGNAVIGGAGGIGLAAGMTRAFGLPGYALAVAVATTPVPVALWLLGTV